MRQFRFVLTVTFMAAAVLMLPPALGGMAPLSAEPAVHRGLVTGDHVKGWQAVGKLLLGKRGFCTGVLIEPQLVLTAAHCLFDEEGGTRLEDQAITFQAGWRNGRAAAYRNVRQAFPHPDYSYSGGEDLGKVALDLALLELEQPILLSQLTPYRVAQEPQAGDRVAVVSYAMDRADVPSIERDCGVIAHEDAALILSCDIDFGSSGAPVFSLEGGEPRLVSIISAKAELAGRKVALAVPMERLLSELQALRERESPIAQQESSNGVRVILGGSAKTGARFIKP